MKFLNDLYANEYFGVVLFGIIAFLILLFIVILFFGVSDAKKDKKKKNVTVEEDNTLVPFAAIDDTCKLEVVKDEKPVVEEVKDIPNEVTETIDPITETVNKEIVIKKPVIDLSNLTIQNFDGSKEIKEEIKEELAKNNDDEEIELPMKKKIDDISPETYDI